MVPGEKYSLYLYFSDGSVRLAELESLIEKGRISESLRDKKVFREALTVMNHTVAWDIAGTCDCRSCIDLDPVSLYEKSAIIREPSDEMGPF